MAKKRVILHGYLKDLYPGEISMEASTVAELINGLCRQTKAFNPSIGQDRHVLRVVGFDTQESLYEQTNQEEIHIVPAFFGGKSGGLFKIAIGAVLIGLSFIPGLGQIGQVAISSLLFSFGTSMVLGGLLELLSPAPKIDLSGGADDPEASKYLGAPKNTVKIGTRIPLIFGEHVAYGHFLSFDIDAKDVAV